MLLLKLKLMFLMGIMNGTIVPDAVIDDRQTYTIKLDSIKEINYAYKAEVIKYLETGEFLYDEDLTKGE
jgi:hypothetical protein